MDNRKLLASVLIAFLLVAGIGAATSFLGDASKRTVASGSNGDMLALLAEYAGSGGTREPAPAAAAGKSLPDVKTMIDRLAARLEGSPDDVKGWRMLGWSYFHTGLYEQAALAYAKAVALDPNSSELKLSYEEAKAKASGSPPSMPTETVRNGGDEIHIAKKSEMAASGPYDAAVRSMVDGLTNRLERSPRDAEGWMRLMRSRVVLGEREVAAEAFRKALEVFKDDSVVSDTIASAAVELGLKAE